MKIVSDIGPCYEKPVMEFIVNLSLECNKEESEEFRKMYVRGCYVKFSPEVINDYLGRIKLTEIDEVPSLDKIAQFITTNQIKERPRKYLLSTAKLSVTYIMLNMVGAFNWSPTNHISSIYSGLDK